jgi:hypothetical protein
MLAVLIYVLAVFLGKGRIGVEIADAFMPRLA